MTTRIHIVNYGPKPVNVTANDHIRATLYSQQSYDEYVFDGQDIVVKEISQDVKQVTETKRD
jgi:hypothetical protein